MSPLEERTRSALDDGRLSLPPLGAGRTAERWSALVALAAADVDLARLAEAHVDAVQIIAESGATPPAGQLLGVWAAEQPSATVTAEWDATGALLVLTGSKPFCSGASIVDAALVTVTAPEGRLLVHLPMSDMDPDRIDASVWRVRALSAVGTATVDLSGVTVPRTAVIGAPGWYLDRPGFWDGAVGPAACWAGAAIGLVGTARERCSDDPHALAHLGALTADERALRSILDGAGHEQDAGAGGGSTAQRRALEVRHLVDTLSADVEARFGRCLGPRSLAFDESTADRLQALSIYRRQCHGERDLAVLGAIVTDEGRERP